MFSHLHTHSCYSFLEGLPTPVDLVRAAVRHAMPALALTDHNSLTGALAFYRACRANSIQPILGLEIDLLLPYRLSTSPAAPINGLLVLLAADLTGWHNLCRLSSYLLSGPQDAPTACTLEILASHADGLLCMTGGCRGALQNTLSAGTAARPVEQTNIEAHNLLGQLKEIFPNRLYVELSQQNRTNKAINEAVTQLAGQSHLPLAAAHSIHYLEPEQAALQRTLTAIRCITPLDQLTSEQCAPEDAHFLSPADAQKRFAAWPDALAGTEEIVSRCNLQLELGKAHYPQVNTPPGMSAADLLRKKTYDGAARLYGQTIPDEINRRLESELNIITARGYEPIFLIAEEMIAFAHQQDIPSASRGSASSSLVAHCINVTTPDPLALDLYFERFLNPARTTPPDIDTDFCSRRRDDVIQHLFETYGTERVAMVGTVNTFRPRSALSEVAKAHGLKAQETRGLVNRLFHHYWRHTDENQPSGQSGGGPFAELIAEHGRNTRYAPLFEEAAQLLGLPHHLSVHPGGVVIAPGPITDFVPVARSGGKGVIITQFDLDDVEQAGLVKLDLLGIRGLTVLSDVAASIHSWRRKEFRGRLDVLDSVPNDDPDTAALVGSGHTIGCFQIESPGMRATLKDIQARSITDIIAALALYRPGPLKGGLRDAFVRRYKHQEPVTHLHPGLSGLLNETYGVILYQEQVLRIAHELAGFSLSEADLLRRAMSHFDPGKQMQVLKEKFIRGAEARSSVPPETGARIWEMMAAFAGYGFPKAHAASYAEVAWRSAWCKAHYPAEFIAAVLANWGGYYPQSVYMSEVRRMGLTIRPPHVNHAREQFSVSYPRGEPVLYMGLDQIRDLTRRTQERILRYRPFNNLSEFILKVDPRMKEVESLIQVGGFEGVGTIPDLLQELSAGRPRPGQLSLFALNEASGEDWTVEQKAGAQQRLLGTSLEVYPLEIFAKQLAEAGAISTVEAAAKIGEKVVVGGMRQIVFRSLTAHGEWMGFVTLEDLDGMLDVVLLPDVYRKARSILSSNAIPFIIEGMMERDASTGDPVLHAEQVSRVKG